MPKAQVQAISMVLIAGIVISLAGVAYFWGRPMIEKRSTLTDISTAESFMVQLDSHILDLARSGGTKTLNNPQIAGVSLYLNATGDPVYENELIFQFFTTQAMLGMGEGSMSIPVETYDESPVGAYGGSPRIITLEGQPEGDQYLMTLRLRYRQLEADDPAKGYRIVLADGGRTGHNQVTVSFIGTEAVSGACCGGSGDLIKTNINLTIS
jgi:hypothetical protein